MTSCLKYFLYSVDKFNFKKYNDIRIKNYKKVIIDSNYYQKEEIKMEIQAAKPIPLSTMFLKKRENKLQLRPSYQRGLVWDNDRKRLLVDSVLRGKYIPEILIGQPEDLMYEESVIDGQQRINTVLDFMENKIKIKSDTIIDNNKLDGFTFDELPENLKERVKAYCLNVVRINGSKEEIEDMFRRLQGGIALNKVETRHSIGGKIKDYIKNEMLKHPFFVDSIGVTAKNNKRFKYYEVAEQFLVLELNNVTTDIKDGNINEVYDKYNVTGIPDEVKVSINQKLDYLSNAFAGNYKMILSKKVNAINVYLVAKEYLKNYFNLDSIQEFANWYATFEQERIRQKGLPPEERDKVFADYIDYASQGTASKESLQGRQKVLYQSWLDHIK